LQPGSKRVQLTATGFDSVPGDQATPGDVLFAPPLISSDANPAQRLTFSKRVFRDVEVVVSQSLRESGDITWVVSWQPVSGLEQFTFDTAPELVGEWGLSSDDQRHRAVFNGIWEVGKGFQVSALHFFVAGLRLAGSWGGDLRQTGAANSARLRPDGSIVPRNALIAPKQNRTDVRVQQRIRLGGRFAIDGIAEVFNVFNNYNYGIGTVESVPSQYLQPISAQTRTAQFGFRLTF
jgi:hypothetical protein